MVDRQCHDSLTQEAVHSLETQPASCRHVAQPAQPVCTAWTHLVLPHIWPVAGRHEPAACAVIHHAGWVAVRLSHPVILSDGLQAAMVAQVPHLRSTQGGRFKELAHV